MQQFVIVDDFKVELRNSINIISLDNFGWEKHAASFVHIKCLRHVQNCSRLKRDGALLRLRAFFALKKTLSSSTNRLAKQTINSFIEKTRPSHSKQFELKSPEQLSKIVTVTSTNSPPRPITTPRVSTHFHDLLTFRLFNESHYMLGEYKLFPRTRLNKSNKIN